MISFLLYLFESGLCLTILVLVYFFFFKNETYFRFNRIYLVSIMFLSLLIPFFHVNLNVADTHRYEFALKSIGEFKTYYEKLIAMSDPEYLNNTNKSKIARFEDYETVGTSGMQTEQKIDNSILTDEKEQTSKSIYSNFSLVTLLFIIYVTGVIFFLFRIMLLFQWIFKTIKSNKLKIQHGVKIIELDKKLPPFSFLGYVFLSKDLISKNKQEQILMHEKEHIKQFHSVDLLIAHFITIIQWFNPFVWLLQKAIKNNHEYLADSQVVKKGYNLLNYQELLLNQFISIPSVQLVNNFNLISIKNRIRMMNKIKSGFAAKLKALLIIPAALLTFILFANLTLNGPGNVLTNLSFLETQKNMSQLKGLWNNTSNNTYGMQVLFEDHKFSVIDKNIDLKEYPYQLQGNQVVLNAPGNEKITLNYEITNGKLKIWWNQDEYSLYEKSEYSNSLDDYLSNIPETINLPT
ncbi:MAG: M56 family metallopeptidase, partial [Bacteroidota bacterium]